MNLDLARTPLLGFTSWRHRVWSGHGERQAFRQRLRAVLTEDGVQLVKADVGRAESGQPVWYLTILHPSLGVRSLRAALEQGVDPYSPRSLQNLQGRLRAWLERSAS